MLFTIYKTSDYRPDEEGTAPCSSATWNTGIRAWVVKIEDIGTLMELQRGLECSVILNGLELEIYDDYREH